MQRLKISGKVSGAVGPYMGR